MERRMLKENLLQLRGSLQTYLKSLDKYDAASQQYANTSILNKEDVTQTIHYANHTLEAIEHLIARKVELYEDEEHNQAEQVYKRFLFQETNQGATRRILKDKVSNGQNISLFYLRKPIRSHIYVETNIPDIPWFCQSWKTNKEKPLYTAKV